MNVLNKKFTTKEQVIILILCLILIALAYYHFVDQPVRSAIAEANAERDTVQIELDAAQTKLASLQKMEQELDGEGQDDGYMLSYNGIKSEMTLLNDVMTDAEEYSLSFEDVTRDGDQIRRNFTAEFTAESYDVAISMLNKIAESEYRCVIDSVSVTSAKTKTTTEGYYLNGRYIVTNIYGDDEDDDISTGRVTVTCNATFYETMYDGKADSGLPEEPVEDTSETEEEES